MPRPMTSLDELARALDDKAPRLALDPRLAAMVAKAAADGPAAVCRDLARLFDKDKDMLDRELRGEVGEVPQKAKDMMRAEALAAMERLLDEVTKAMRAYRSADGQAFERK